MEYTLSDRQRFSQVLNSMSQQGVVKLEEDDTLIKAINLTSNYYNFYWSLIWPVVESYWVTCLYLFKLESTSEPMALTKLISQIQWFEQSLINDRICSFL